MTARDRMLAALVAVFWGLNFLAVRIGLDHFPPFFLAALRYLVLAVPVVLFVPFPDVRLRWLLGYGLGFGAFQFGLLFLAIDMGMPTGLSSVVVQASAPLTVLLGALLLSERVSGRGLVGIGLAVLGMVAIGVDRAQATTLLPMALTLLAALGWALGNLSSRLARPSSPLRFALWMSVVPPVPLLALSAAMEGPTTGWVALGAALGPRAGPVSPPWPTSCCWARSRVRGSGPRCSNGIRRVWWPRSRCSYRWWGSPRRGWCSPNGRACSRSPGRPW